MFRGKVFEQRIVYEWKPLYCQKYLQVGHSWGENPSEIIPKKQEQGPMKEWKVTNNKTVINETEKEKVEVLKEKVQQ